MIDTQSISYLFGRETVKTVVQYVHQIIRKDLDEREKSMLLINICILT